MTIDGAGGREEEQSEQRVRTVHRYIIPILMLSAQQQQQMLLVGSCKLERMLSGHLFPLNNNRGLMDLEDMYAITVITAASGTAGDKEKAEEEGSPTTAKEQIVGFGLFHKCSPCQFYCSLVSVSKRFEQLFVNVERVVEKVETEEKEQNANGTSAAGRRHILLRLTDVHQSLPDLSTLPQYFSAFADPIGRPLLQCIVDEFIRAHVGAYEVETRCNFTVDLYDSNSGTEEHSDTLWRDFAGFVVMDRFRYCEIDFDSPALALSALDNESFVFAGVHPSVVLRPLSPSNRALFHDYDQSVSVTGREEYLDFLLNLTGMEGTIAIDEQRSQPIGYLLAYQGRVLQCYADEEQVAGALLSAAFGAALHRSSSAPLSLFLRLSHDTFPLLSVRLVGAASRVRRMRRFHSRAMPATVKWEKVLSPAIGLDLF